MEDQAWLSSVILQDDQDSPGLFPPLLPRLRQPRPCRRLRVRGEWREGPGGGPLDRPDQGHDHQPDQRHPRHHHHHHPLLWTFGRRSPVSSCKIDWKCLTIIMFTITFLQNSNKDFFKTADGFISLWSQVFNT